MSPSTALKRDARYTWADYRSWPEDERWELIDGVAYGMSAAPSIRHQDVVGGMFSRIEQQLRGGSCRPYIAPTAVRLSEHDVVEPDILVMCDPGKVRPSHIEGPPDLIVEVLSPGTSGNRGLTLKYPTRPRYQNWRRPLARGLISGSVVAGPLG
jgi:Uma2 family endonuclease